VAVFAVRAGVRIWKHSGAWSRLAGFGLFYSGSVVLADTHLSFRVGRVVFLVSMTADIFSALHSQRHLFFFLLFDGGNRWCLGE